MTNKLKLVGLCGVDDRTPVRNLEVLSRTYPWVEWGILYHPEKEGKPRAPSEKWRQEFLRLKLTPGNAAVIKTAVHLCGTEIFKKILHGKVPEELSLYDRIQVNINARSEEFSTPEVVNVYSKLFAINDNLILQYHESTAVAIGVFTAIFEQHADRIQKVGILMDASRGLGRLPETWTWPEGYDQYLIGHAGGLNPNNVAEALVQLDKADRPYWIDMESGVRTDNAFDLGKCQAVLAQSEGFVEQSRR